MNTIPPPGTEISTSNIRVTYVRWDATTSTQHIELANTSMYKVDVESAITVNGKIEGFVMRWEGALPSQVIQEQFRPQNYTNNGVVAWNILKVTIAN